MTETPEELAELRVQWAALVDADTLHMMPPFALIASIQNLAGELLQRTQAPEELAELRLLARQLREQYEWRVVWFPPDRKDQTRVGTEEMCRSWFQEEKLQGHCPILECRTVIASEWGPVELA